MDPSLRQHQLKALSYNILNLLTVKHPKSNLIISDPKIFKSQNTEKLQNEQICKHLVKLKEHSFPLLLKQQSKIYYRKSHCKVIKRRKVEKGTWNK